MKPEVEFSDCMCLSIRKASRNITQAYNEEFQGLGINITQFSVLAILDSMTVSCYQPSKDGHACGKCDSCRLRREGFQKLGVKDPTLYM